MHDHLAAVGLHKIVVNRAASKSIQHACPSTDDGTCACCFAGGARAHGHKRDDDRERRKDTWHADVIGPVREHGLGFDPVGNFKSGQYAALYTNDAYRDIVFPILRSTTRSSETEGDITLVRGRTAGAEIEIRSYLDFRPCMEDTTFYTEDSRFPCRNGRYDFLHGDYKT